MLKHDEWKKKSRELADEWPRRLTIAFVLSEKEIRKKRSKNDLMKRWKIGFRFVYKQQTDGAAHINMKTNCDKKYWNLTSVS
jgi:hypothetical protein